MFGVRLFGQRPFGSWTFEEIQTFLNSGFSFSSSQLRCSSLLHWVWRGFRNGSYRSLAFLNPATLCPGQF